MQYKPKSPDRRWSSPRGFSAVKVHRICRRDVVRAISAHGIRENLSGGISWFTFYRALGDRLRVRAPSNPRLFAYRKPSSVRCSTQSTGNRDAPRINVIALRCCGCRPLMIAVVMSGANHRRRNSV